MYISNSSIKTDIVSIHKKHLRVPTTYVLWTNKKKQQYFLVEKSVLSGVI